MVLSMFEISIPVCVRMLGNLSAILGKAEAWAEQKKIDPPVLTSARLAPDMFPLSRQVQIACDMAKGCAARLAGVEVPSYADSETTFPELQERIAKTVEFINGCDRAKIDGSETRSITLKMRGEEIVMQGLPYLTGFVLPNLYFHITTAYAILRHNGLDIGKMDYLGQATAGEKKAA